jgi:hypothetical protein
VSDGRHLERRKTAALACLRPRRPIAGGLGATLALDGRMSFVSHA